MTVIMDGKLLSEIIINQLKIKTGKLEKKPHLVVFLAGNNSASRIYVNNKKKKAEYIGFTLSVVELPSDISEKDFLEQIYIMNDDSNINAMLIQLPLPNNLNSQKIIESVDPIKDADGFTSYNFGWMALGYNPYAVPCTPKGIIRLLDEYKVNPEGKNVIVIGRSNIVGKPLSLMLQQRNATVTMAHSKTENLAEIASSQDIVISAIGIPNFINSKFIKKGAVVIDVGINRTEKGITGDVDFNDVKDKVSMITPVPGGVGPMTIAMLLENTFELFQIQQNFVL